MLLIIDENKIRRETLREAFYIMGVLAVAHSPTGALNEFANKYKAILVYGADLIYTDYIGKVRKIYPSAAVFAFSEGEEHRFGSLPDNTLPADTLAPVILACVNSECERLGISPPARYMIMGLDACESGEARYFGRAVRLTKTEIMILRYFIASYPTPKSVGDVLKHAYRNGRVPEAGAVRTEISIINKKLYDLTGKKVIERRDGGYVISTPSN